MCCGECRENPWFPRDRAFLDRIGMEQALEVLDHEAAQIVMDIGIPPCPGILTKLMREMRNDEPDFARLGNLIGGDVSLAAAMLKTVNSPFYGLRSKATSVQQSITLLGLRNVAQLVTGLLLRNAFPGGSTDLMDEYWESSSAIAQISACLAREFSGVSRDEAYTFALFRDCGMLAMMGAYPDYEPIFPGAKPPAEGSVTVYEDQCHGMNHARVGCQLAKTWLLPDEICQAVLWHHDYAAVEDGSAGIPAASRRHIAVALVAESLFVREKIGTTSSEWSKGEEFALAALGIAPADLDAAKERVMRESALF
jgi:HD-like signal output (HDOD) protein